MFRLIPSCFYPISTALLVHSMSSFKVRVFHEYYLKWNRAKLFGTRLYQTEDGHFKGQQSYSVLLSAEPSN